MPPTWDAALYDSKHSFVAALGASVLELLAARPGESVLDLGCGTGEHVAQLRSEGVLAVGVDSSREMIERAQEKHPGLPFEVRDARALGFDGEFDAVFSNAALHWIPESADVARSVRGALKPHGRFVAELGGVGNVASVVDTMNALRSARGLPQAPSPWYFPSIGEYTSVLESAGFEVRQAFLFDRPTPLEDENGLATWVRMFGAHWLTDVTESDSLLTDLQEELRPRLYRDGRWFADYRRLRIVALKPG